MPQYALFQNPGHNRVYFKASRIMAFAELRLTGLPFENLREEILGNIPYLVFDVKTRLNKEDIILLSRLSFVYVIFERTGDSLFPIDILSSYYFNNNDIITILKYNGKTNELFTRMILNIAMFCSKFNPMDKLSILDPLCGKGTTCFDGLLLGHNVCGIETDAKIVHEAYVFFKKYLENARYKHTGFKEKQRINNNARRYTAQRYKFKLSRNKNDNNPLEAEFVVGDARDAEWFYKKNTFHIIAGDLPYGVQHKKISLLSMLQETLPGWYKVLKPGGTLAIAWNLLLIDKTSMEDAFQNAGFKLTLAESDFEHRVDQAIRRDLIVGLKQ